MSLKKFRLLAILTLSVCLIVFGRLQTDRLVSLWPTSRAPGDQPTTDVDETITYRIGKNHWTRFALPQGRISLRCLFNANLPEPITGVTWNYRIAWRWLDAMGDSLGEGDYTLRTRLTRYRNEAGREQFQLFYEKGTSIPADGRRLVLRSDDLARSPAYIDFRLENADHPIETVAIRVSALHPKPVDDLRKEWQRISRRERQQLKAENALGSLQPSELENLIRNRHRPIGPIGVVGRDYFANRLYTLAEPGTPTDETRVENEPPEEGALRLKVWRLIPGQKLVYRIQARRTASTPFRLELRNLLPALVNYTVADESGKVLAKGTLEPESLVSPYDYLNENEEVGEPHRYFFNLPPTATELRLVSDSEVICGAWLRPMELPRRWIQGLSPDEDVWLPGWFSLVPEEGGTAAILLQRSRPQAPMTIAPGFIQELMPMGDWLGRHVLLPRPTSEWNENASLTGVFTSLATNRMLHYQPETKDGSGVYPILIFQRKSRKPVALSVEIDGKTRIQETISARGGEYSLGEMTPGRHRIKIVVNDEDMRIWINHARPRAEFQRRRLACRLEERPLRFDFIKPHQGRFTLTTRILRMSGGKPVVLRARIVDPKSGLGPHRGLSFQVHEMTLGPATEGTVRMPSGPKQKWAESRPWFIHIDEDLPPGKYRLELEKISGRTSYVLLSHLKILERLPRHSLFKARPDHSVPTPRKGS